MKTKDCEASSVKDFYKGKNIFITGGSGFIGKAVIEKLLRSCPDVGKIYVLLRPKRNKSIYERLEEMLTSPVFDLIKSKSPQCVKKIIPINGDMCNLALGISECDRDLLKTEINIFINAAASVRFDDMIKDAIISNLRSTREAALLALEMKNIMAFLHVSTSYCNIDKREVIEEILYPSPQPWNEAISIAENVDPNLIDVISQKFIGDFPNTYTYSKRLAEHCINDLLVGKVPTVICRPSIVTTSLEEPFEGWTDNLNGPVGLLIAAGTGLLRMAYGISEKSVDYIPIDNVAKGILITIWHKAKFENRKQLAIYHQTRVGFFQHKMGDFAELGEEAIWKVPFEKTLWLPGGRMTPCAYDYYFFVIISHVIPALFLDAILKIVGRQPRIFKIQRKIYNANKALSFFMHNEWKFVNNNICDLFYLLSTEDKKDFNFLNSRNSKQAVHNHYVRCTLYCRRYILKEKDETIQASTNKLKRLYFLSILTRIMYSALAVWLLVIKLNIPGKIWESTYNYWNSL